MQKRNEAKQNKTYIRMSEAVRLFSNSLRPAMSHVLHSFIHSRYRQSQQNTLVAKSTIDMEICRDTLFGRL